MRRSPNEAIPNGSTNVFSNEAWSDSTSAIPSYTSVGAEETIDLSKYAATGLPDNFTSTARTPRYTPSPHSPQYETSENLTNSENDPFDHSAYDGRPAAPMRQNASYGDMPSSTRKRKLGSTSQGLTSEPITTATPQAPPAQHVPQIPQAPQAPQATLATPAPPAPAQSHYTPVPQMPPPVAPQTQQAYTPAPNKAPQIDQDFVYRPASQNSTVPQVEQKISPTAEEIPAPINSVPVVDETIDEEIPLSDFERDFIEEKMIDLTQDTIEVKAGPVAPSIFNTGAVQAYEPITYNTNDSIFGTQHRDIPDSDRLYSDLNPTRETFQIDLDLFRRLFSKVSIKVLVIGLVLTFILIAAYIIVKPATSSSTNPSKVPSESRFLGTEKTVVPSDNPAVPDTNTNTPPLNTGEQIYVDPAGDPNIYPDNGGGAIVTYDENGNAVYTSPSNQNFNGD